MTSSTRASAQFCRLIRLCLGVGLLLCCLARADADWIVLNDGVQFHGKILRENDKELTLQCDSGGVLSFRKNQIKTVHRLDTPADKPKKESDQPPRAIVEYDPSELKAPEKLVAHQLDKATLRLPATFVQTKRRQTVSGYAGELLGLFEDSRDKARCSASLSGYAMDSPDFDSMVRNLRQHFLWTRGFTLSSWQRKRVAGRTALYAEMRKTTADGKTGLVLQAWIEVEPAKILSISVVLDEALFLTEPDRYRAPFQSLVWGVAPPPESPKQPSPPAARSRPAGSTPSR